MEEWGAMARVMIWIVFGLFCLWFMKAKLGIGAADFIAGIMKELRMIKFLRTERAGLNMAGGLFLLAIVAVYILFDAVGRFQKIAHQSGTTSLDGKAVLVGASLLVIGAYFLLCISLVSNRFDKD